MTYANVVATLALFVALGGGAYAAGVLPRNTVGPRQLRRNSVTSAKIKNGAVTTNKLRDGAVTGSKLAPGAVGTVANATNAGHAGDADQLGGTPASAFLKSVPAGFLKGSDSIGGGDLGGTYAAPALNSGVVGPSKLGTIPGARVTNTGGTESVDVLTSTPITFDTEDYDNDGLHSTSSDTSRLTAPIAGDYVISGNIQWFPQASGVRELNVVKNGTTTLGYTEVPVTQNGQQVTTQAHLAAGDYVELVAFQNSANNTTISNSAASRPLFMMHWLGP